MEANVIIPKTQRKVENVMWQLGSDFEWKYFHYFILFADSSPFPFVSIIFNQVFVRDQSIDEIATKDQFLSFPWMILREKRHFILEGNPNSGRP